MMKDKFNKYCSEVMGHELHKRWHGRSFFYYGDIDADITGISSEKISYNPFDDLNQMVEVFDVLWNRCRTSKSYITKCLSFSPKGDCKKAIRDFIISCMETNHIAETTND